MPSACSAGHEISLKANFLTFLSYAQSQWAGKDDHTATVMFAENSELSTTSTTRLAVR
ncbi:hypothetical protein BVI1335_2300003 [Burkholderia vietnamiensis]|nr:hypothetical protein BVI1335_2300003 [Burkholderia vietnamiensis]